MRFLQATLLGIVLVAGAAPALADRIPCTHAPSECMANFACSALGFCTGDPINEGMTCTTSDNPCMTNPVCNKHGLCEGTVAVTDPTVECSIAGLEKCYNPGHCMAIPNTNVSLCTGYTPKACRTPSGDPCKVEECNPQTGECITGDKCFTFSGCETCNNGTCTPVNVDPPQPCANAEGDFNECTTDDKCVSVTLEGQTRGFCMGVPLSGPVPTPTMGPTLCAGDCNFDGQTTVDELVTMARVLLGDAPFNACLLGDANHNGKIGVDDVVAGIASVIGNCHGIGTSLR